jgi:hypothetical protein
MKSGRTGIQENRLMAICVSLAMFVFSFGCATPKVADPLEGWNHCFNQDPARLDQAIQDDYRDYIRKLPPKEQRVASYDYDYEDGTGRHAVLITVGIYGTNWRHVLIYDKENKRIKTIKYADGDSRS